jgi:rare lipoprotein A
LNRVLFFLVLTLLQLPLLGQNQSTTGYCSFYADKFQGRYTSSGDRYEKYAYTAAHRSLPFNTIIEITNLRNQKKVLVRVNDRGPHTKNRILDVSKAAALTLDMIAYGVEKVSYRLLDSVTSAWLLDTLRNTRYQPDGVKPVVKQMEKKVVPTPEKTTVTKTPEVVVKNHDVFDKDMNPARPQGYGVQVGYYKNKGNCTAAIATYEKTYKNTGYFWVEKFTSSTYYHLIMGNFPDKEQAEKLRQQIIKTIPGCFVMAWNKI